MGRGRRILPLRTHRPQPLPASRRGSSTKPPGKGNHTPPAPIVPIAFALADAAFGCTLKVQRPRASNWEDPVHRTLLLTLIGLLALIFAAAPASAQPLTTAFTYQGSLTSNGLPADGFFDLRFRLLDQAGTPGGVQIGPTLCIDNLQVIDGRFSAALDFGAVFAGQRRFLEVAVRPGSVGTCGVLVGYTVLEPRQEVTAAPNAAFALTAGTASSLNGQPASFYTNAANLTSGTIPDQRLSTNVATIGAAQTFSGTKTFSAAPSFTSAGAPFAVSSASLVSNLNADLLDGLSAAAFAPASHTHDAAAITTGLLNDARVPGTIPRLASVNAFTAVNSFGSSVGLGTTTPTARLHVRDAANLPTPLSESSVAPFKITNGFGGGVLMDSNQIESVGGPLYLNFRGDGAGNDVSLAAGGGRVGIGTGAPATPLEVAVAPSQSLQLRLDGFVPGVNVATSGGNAGIMRLRNAVEVWPSDDGTRAGRVDIRNTAGNATIALNGATGAISSANFPASKSSQTFRNPRSLSAAVTVPPGQFRTFETISVSPPGPGNLIITATANVMLPDPSDVVASTAWLKIEETTGGPVTLLTEAAHLTNTRSNPSGIETGSVITLVWTVPVSGPGTRSFQTVVTCAADGLNPGTTYVYTTTLTVVYMPAGL